MIHHTRTFKLMAAMVALGAAPLFAAAPYYISYQGRLVSKSGTPVTGSQTLVFNVCSDSNGSICGGDITVNSVPFSNGVFSALIGPIPETTFTNGIDRYLKIKWGSESFSPLQKLVAAPYALAVAADTVGAAEVVNGSLTKDDLSASAGIAYTQLNLNDKIRGSDISSTSSNAIPATKIKGGTFVSGTNFRIEDGLGIGTDAGLYLDLNVNGNARVGGSAEISVLKIGGVCYNLSVSGTSLQGVPTDCP